MPEVDDLVKALDDLNGFDEVKKLLQNGGDVPWNGKPPDVPKGPLDKVMGPVGKAIDFYTTAKGSYQVAEGIDSDDDVEVVDGVHDLLDGGSGLLGDLPGPWGAAMKAFNAGFTVGDYAAPYVYNDAAYEGARSEAPSEDGQYHAHTGNETVDGVIDGTRMISNGDYVDGGLEIADSALDGAEAMGIPGAATINSGVNLAKWAFSDDD